MKALVIYDATGRIWLISYGEETLPQGLTCMFVDIPDGAQIESIDVTNPDDPQPVFTYLPESDIGRLQKEVEKLKATDATVTLAASFAAESFSDEQAVKVPELYDKWAAKDDSGAAIHYEVGGRRRYGEDNTLYKCITAHDSQDTWNPVDAPSLWAKILIPDPLVIPEWEQPDSTNGYSIGDKVTHNGKTWESLVNNNVWEPGATGTESLWKDITSESLS